MASIVTGDPSEPPLQSCRAGSAPRSPSLTVHAARKRRAAAGSHSEAGALRRELGPPALSLPHPSGSGRASRGGARAWQQPGEGGRQAGRQAAGGDGKNLSSPAFSKPESPSPSCTPGPWVAASRHACSLQWAGGRAPSLARAGGTGRGGGTGPGSGVRTTRAPFSAGVTGS